MMCWGMSLVAHKEAQNIWIVESGYESLGSSPTSSITFRQDGGEVSSYQGCDVGESTVSSASSAYCINQTSIEGEMSAKP